MERNPKILVVDDDPRLRDLLRRYLGENGFQVFVSENGAAMSRLWVREHFDALILDLMMPGEDGLQILRRLLAAKDMTPVIMLTARDSVIDKVSGLEMGADDYIVKPFEMKEVLARIHAVMRRFGGDENGTGEKKLSFDKLVINLDSYELLVDGKRVDTPPKELELLYHLASAPNRVFTRNQLLDEVWGFDYFGDSRTVDVHIKRLREKLEGVSDQWSLKTVWGVGYKFEVVTGG